MIKKDKILTDFCYNLRKKLEQSEDASLFWGPVITTEHIEDAIQSTLEEELKKK